MHRRRFLRVSSSAAALTFLDAHLLLPQLACSSSLVTSKSPLITSLRLLTAAPLADMKTFYCDLIGFELVSETASELEVRGGLTDITFVKTDNPDQQPFYHFAFNIPENKILAAYAWQKTKTPIVFPRPGARNEWHTEGHPREVYNFQHWNAHSVFFLDPASNLVEYIARHELPNASPVEDFSVKDILYASEIGFIVEAPDQAAVLFQEHLKVQPYIGNSGTFQPMGDAYGLLLLFQTGTLWTDQSGKGHPTRVFRTDVKIQSTEKKVWTLPGYPYKISTTP